MVKKKKIAAITKKNKTKPESKTTKKPKVKTSIPISFYSHERWNNWISQVKESGFEYKEGEEDAGNTDDVFINMEDDVILACLKVIAKYNNNELTGDAAFEAISEIKEVVLKPIDHINESIDEMLYSLQTSMIAVFASSECYIDGGHETQSDLMELIKNAVGSEEANDPTAAIGYIAVVGAHVLNGTELTEDMSADLPYGLVAEWVDGIDSIAAAMMGDDSYKNDEPDTGTS